MCIKKPNKDIRSVNNNDNLEKEKICSVNNKEELIKEVHKGFLDLKNVFKEINLKEKFRKYELVRQQGRYNMFDNRSIVLSGLSKEDYIYIMKNYNELVNKYPNVKREVQQQLNFMESAKISKIIGMYGCSNCVKVVSNKLDVTLNDLCSQCKKLFDNEG